MSGTTSVPSPSLGDAGFVAPAEADILAGVLADLNAAFGGNLAIQNADGTPKLDTPQGQLATSLGAIVADKNNQFLFMASQVDPAFARGRMQDAIARIYFIERDPARPTTVECLCTGAAGVVIPTGALAQANDGNLYLCTAGGTIGTGGTVTLPFACTTAGPIPCPAGSFTIPYQAIPSWDSIANVTDGVIGNAVESRAAFEVRRAASVALNGTGSLPAVRGAVLAVTNVLDAYVTENTDSAPVTIGGVTIAAHSLYVAAAGGDPAVIAKAIWTKKGTGCGYTGNTAVTVTDTSYSVPYPSYQVLYQVPTATPVLFAVTIANSAAVPSTALTLIQAALISAFSGGDGGARARIGGTIYASRYYACVAALGAWAQIVSIEIGTVTPDQFSIVMQIDQVPTISAAGITVTLV